MLAIIAAGGSVDVAMIVPGVTMIDVGVAVVVAGVAGYVPRATWRLFAGVFLNVASAATWDTMIVGSAAVTVAGVAITGCSCHCCWCCWLGG